MIFCRASVGVPNARRASRWGVRFAAVCLLGALGSAAPAFASPIFKWIDERGDFHATDRLADVPEPYRSMYEARLAAERAAAEARAKAQAEAGQRGAPNEAFPKTSPKAQVAPASKRPPRAESSAQGFSAREDALRKTWLELVKHWRDELHAATVEVEDIEKKLEEAGQNPLLRHTPPVKLELENLERTKARALGRVAEARRMLIDELPKRARKEGIPPKWLQ